MLPLVTSVLIGYLLGSIPFGYLLVRTFRGSDVRSSGSGNIGATNVARTSPLLGIATLALDVCKGVLAVGLVMRLFPHSPALAYPAAFAAIVGHVFPVWLGFKGGKGVATGLGAFLLLTPKAILFAICVFLVVATAFRWISLASIIAAASLPICVLVSGENRGPGGLLIDSGGHVLIATPVIWVFAGAILIIAKHHANIRRLLSGTEPRFAFKRK